MAESETSLGKPSFVCVPLHGRVICSHGFPSTSDGAGERGARRGKAYTLGDSGRAFRVNPWMEPCSGGEQKRGERKEGGGSRPPPPPPLRIARGAFVSTIYVSEHTHFPDAIIVGFPNK